MLHDVRHLDKDHQNEMIKKRNVFEKIIEGVLKEGVDKGIFRIKDTKLITYALLGMNNWMYQWYSPEERLHPEEIAEWQERDPVPMFARTLMDEGLATEQQLYDMEQALEKELDAAVEFAENSRSPELDEATTDVYAESIASVDRTSQRRHSQHSESG